MRLPGPVVEHSVGVAEFMAGYAKSHPGTGVDPYEYYVIGLLHDIGKLYPGDIDPSGKNRYKNHAKKGGDLLQGLGFSFFKEVKHHGHPEDGYFSHAWLILNLADLSVNGKGEIVPLKVRLNDIKQRYGEFSDEYCNSVEIFNMLVGHRIIRPDGSVI